jgi:succinate dehydrogenase / fumarate reductase, cytochrome b subunit
MYRMANVTRERPLSPHIQIFRPLITMVMSIVHRITGIALYFGTALVVWWLVAAASGPGAFATASGVFGSWFGLLVLFGFSWALIHHALGGVRHFVWDLGYGYDAVWRNRLAWLTLIGSVSITVVLWLLVLALG